MAVRESLVELANAAVEAASKAPEGYRFGRHKVFLARLATRHGRVPRYLADLLLEAHQGGLLRLARADLVQVMNRSLVADSRIVRKIEG